MVSELIKQKKKIIDMEKYKRFLTTIYYLAKNLAHKRLKKNSEINTHLVATFK